MNRLVHPLSSSKVMHANGKLELSHYQLSIKNSHYFFWSEQKIHIFEI